ncbi:pyrroline-5-carboxylate reductase [Allorhodopirellula solitaria]|uniref:Pyrroline-5-carboxylate reductase n=1 Tax=Allorhodopirellula solitaria TaxID=2527987 RepID=A0A5C5WPL1_9BACT|nr:pyrroline-5-carboxylate reductase [Allorhodopirellula solitaria]TWT52109.1 Pyrroline-5-carboxylate reductase [Allorhodopirellula solitaria]
MKLPHLTVIGGGQMARALVGGMIDQSVLDAEKLSVIANSESTGQWWQENYPGCEFYTAGSSEATDKAIAGSEIIMLAVKPHIIPTVLADTQGHLMGKLVISVAAGVPLAKLTEGAGHKRVARVMPNTPSLVGEGASAYCSADEVTAADVESIEAMLGSVGYVAPVTEGQLDAVTGVSGSGPAYVFLIIEALADGGVAAGLPRKTALDLAIQTVRGAATMVRDTGEHPGVLKDKVCSPGGTTIAAIRSLEQNAVRGALIDAVAASAGRSRELAQ